MYLNKLNGEKFSYCVVKMLAGTRPLMYTVPVLNLFQHAYMIENYITLLFIRYLPISIIMLVAAFVFTYILLIFHPI